MIDILYFENVQEYFEAVKLCVWNISSKILFVLLCFGFVIIFCRYFILMFTISIFVFTLLHFYREEFRIMGIKRTQNRTQQLK